MPKTKEVGLDLVRRTNVTKLSSFIEVEGQRDVRELSNTSMQRRYVDQRRFKVQTLVEMWFAYQSKDFIEDEVKGRGMKWYGEMIKNVLVHSMTRGFAVPKTVRLRQSLSLNLFGVQTQITGIHLVDKNFKNQIT